MSGPVDVLSIHPTPWRVAECGSLVRMDADRACQHAAEEDCIVDAAGVEVIATSEWLRGTENLQFIVDCVNRSVSE